jgi:hypothetical protein
LHHADRVLTVLFAGASTTVSIPDYGKKIYGLFSPCHHPAGEYFRLRGRVLWVPPHKREKQEEYQGKCWCSSYSGSFTVERVFASIMPNNIGDRNVKHGFMLSLLQSSRSIILISRFLMFRAGYLKVI